MIINSGPVKQIALAVAIGLMIQGSASAQGKPRLDKNGIILPGTALSKEDQKAMNKILKQYDKSLYRIDKYEKGELKKTHGTLSDVVIGQKLVSDVAENAKKRGFTQFAIRIGVPEGVAHRSPVTGTASGVGHHATPTPGEAIGGVGHHPIATPSGETVGVGHATPTPVGGSVPHVASLQTHDAQDSDELVKRLKPIFEKYNKE
jgi:hypothetical protein